MVRPLLPVSLSEEQQDILQSITRSRESPQGLVQRAQIILSASAGDANKTISQTLELREDTVGLWRRRWLDYEGLEKLAGKPKQLRGAIVQLLTDSPRPGNPGKFTAEQVCLILAVACETPPEHLSHWTQPELARTVRAL